MGNAPLVTTATEELAILRRDKVQLTPQREAVIKALRSRTEEHLTAEEIHLEAKKYHRRVGLATVYRTLDLLTNLGIVRTIKVGKGSTKYEVTRAQHAHFICLGCGRVFDIDEQLTGCKLAIKSDREVMASSVQIFGYCSECQLKKDEQAPIRKE
jgi:Fur family ferric uptake transcriptional regulator